MTHAEITVNPTNAQLDFTHLPLREELLKNLSPLGYEVMTPIQEQSLPTLLKGADVIAQAKTGSGKTVAFGLSLLNSLVVENFGVQALVLCPTRELAEQVIQALRKLARLLPNVKMLNLSGGIPMKAQLDSIKYGAHIIVGTPGRVLKHLGKETLSLAGLSTLVLDEADKMLDMGFLDDIRAVVKACPARRQTLLFSATYPPEIKQLSHQFMRKPQEILLETADKENVIEQIFYAVKSPANKFALLKTLLLHHQPASTLIFCNTKQLTVEVCNQLKAAGFSALALNGDMDQGERDQVLIRFINHSTSIVVATDVAARGIDIKELSLVVNYELAFEHDAHIHRIGRTGRAGHHGLALSLTTPADSERMNLIKENLSQPIRWGDASALSTSNKKMKLPEMVTVCLSAGRKDKIRPGDILGALTKDAGLPAAAIGKIDIAAIYSYVAIHQSQIEKAYRYLQNGKLKGRKVAVKQLR